jgi:hypothetical protein
MKNVKLRIDQSVKIGRQGSLRKYRKNTTLRAEELKTKLVKKLSAEYSAVEPRLVYLAVNEAHALASLTPVPLLLLPTLAEEKVQSTAAWSAHRRFRPSGGAMAFAA